MLIEIQAALSSPQDMDEYLELHTGKEIIEDINELIEHCARTAEKAWPPAHTYASENAHIYMEQDHAVRTVVRAIRSLVSTPTEPTNG